jgi:hypothetical protein
VEFVIHWNFVISEEPAAVRARITVEHCRHAGLSEKRLPLDT